MPTYIHGYEIDAILQDDTSTDADITDNPMESGVTTTDHMHVKPKMCTLDCLVSDTPLGLLELRRLEDDIPSDTARRHLEGLQLACQPITLSKTWKRADGSEGSRTYDNMLIQNLTESISPTTGDSYRVKAVFKQATFVTNKRTVVKVAVPRAKKKIDKGNKGTEDGHPPDEAKTRGSVLDGLFTGKSHTTGFEEAGGWIKSQFE